MKPKASASFSLDDFAAALEQHDYQCAKGQVVRGKIHDYASDGVYVDIGGKSPGFLPAKEVDLTHVEDFAALLPQGESFEFLVIREQNADGQVTLSRRQLQLKQAWEDLQTLADQGKPVSFLVTGLNRGGIVGDVMGVKSFIPRSHLVEKEDLESLVGQTLTVAFLEINPETRKLVMSQRQALKVAALKDIEQGALIAGTVNTLKPYGAFVDIGSITGLLHNSQISNNTVINPASVLRAGQEIKVLVQSVDEVQNRVSLATKFLEEYPGELLEKFDEVMATAETRHERAKQRMGGVTTEV